jgi:branched-chain amino acid transport system substrate-binding protein
MGLTAFAGRRRVDPQDGLRSAIVASSSNAPARSKVNSWFKFLFPVVAAVSGIFPFPLGDKATASGDAITIAVAGPMSGDLARFGEQMRRGAEQAVADINAHGGLLGRQIRLAVVDDRCQPGRATAAAEEVADGGAVFVAGHFCSGSSIPASKVYHEHGILQISPASSNPRLTDEASEAGWTNVFRVYGRDDRQAEFAGSWIAASFKAEPIAIVTDGSSYSELLARAAKNSLARAGIKPALEDSIAPGMPDYSELMNELKANKIGVLYFAGHYPEAAVIAKQVQARGLRVRLLGSDALNADEFLAAADFAADGVMLTAEADATRFALTQDVISVLQAQGVTPTDYTIRTYAAVRLWADAAAKAGTTDADKVAATLRAGSWASVLGDIAFDAKGDPTKPDYAVYLIKDGKFAELGR